MIDLRQSQQPLIQTIESSLVRFSARGSEQSLGHLALYSCPWSGWVSVCMDPQPRPEQNCPDFEHVEIGLLEAPDWSAEYEEAMPAKIRGADGLVREVNVEEEGDEAFNRPFFDFLCHVLQTPDVTDLIAAHASSTLRLGVQMLDSELNETWIV